MSIWQAIVLGLVEGITEYLPISSTGHLVLTTWLLGLNGPDQKTAVDAFVIFIQGGAILAVLGLYRRRVGQMISGLFGANAQGRRLLVNLVVAFLPAAVLGPLLNDAIETRLFYPVPVIAALAVGGVVMIVLGPWQRRFYHEVEGGSKQRAGHNYIDLDQLTWRRALVIGLLQCVAMWPGTSRSMVTIVGGMLLGLRARHAAEFSFLLALPTLGGACVYRLAKSVAAQGGEESMFAVLGWLPVVVGLVVATISAALAIKWLVGWLTRHGLSVFGWYRLAIAAVFVSLVWAGRLFQAA